MSHEKGPKRANEMTDAELNRELGLMLKRSIILATVSGGSAYAVTQDVAAGTCFALSGFVAGFGKV